MVVYLVLLDCRDVLVTLLDPGNLPDLGQVSEHPARRLQLRQILRQLLKHENEEAFLFLFLKKIRYVCACVKIKCEIWSERLKLLVESRCDVI